MGRSLVLSAVHLTTICVLADANTTAREHELTVGRLGFHHAPRILVALPSTAAQVGDRGLGHQVGAEERQRRVVRAGAGGIERVHQATPDRGVRGEGKQVTVIGEIDAAPVELNDEQGAAKQLKKSSVDFQRRERFRETAGREPQRTAAPPPPSSVEVWVERKSDPYKHWPNSSFPQRLAPLPATARATAAPPDLSTRTPRRICAQSPGRSPLRYMLAVPPR